MCLFYCPISAADDSWSVMSKSHLKSVCQHHPSGPISRDLQTVASPEGHCSPAVPRDSPMGAGLRAPPSSEQFHGMGEGRGFMITPKGRPRDRACGVLISAPGCGSELWGLSETSENFREGGPKHTRYSRRGPHQHPLLRRPDPLQMPSLSR